MDDSTLLPVSARWPRRRVAAGIAAAIVAPLFIRDLRAREVLRLTPAQTEGPFYPRTLPRDVDSDLLRNGDLRYGQGQPAWLAGTVVDPDGRAVGGASVEIWQCDQRGHYHHPGDGGRADAAFQGFGRTPVNGDGKYRFHTIRPAPYPGRTPHIHVKVKLGVHELLTTQVYVAGDPANATDALWRRMSAADQAAVTVPFESSADGLQARWRIVVQA